MYNKLLKSAYVVFAFFSYGISCASLSLEKEIVVVTASYNNASRYLWNLDSLFAQDYGSWRLIYIDDHSDDRTADLVENYVATCGMQDRVTLIKNDLRRGALYNQYHAIGTCADDAIIVILDGDDALAHPHVLSFINMVYQNSDVWLTYGQFKHLSNNQKGFCIAYPESVVQNNAYRSFGYVPSHLRTFYAKLCKKVLEKDLLYEGNFMMATGDIALMFPMIEMAGAGHFKFIDEVLLIFNDINPLNVYKCDKKLERTIDLFLRAQKPYEPLTSLFS